MSRKYVTTLKEVIRTSEMNYELGRRQGALEELEALIPFSESITSIGGDCDYPQLLEYLEKRIKELEK